MPYDNKGRRFPRQKYLRILRQMRRELRDWALEYWDRAAAEEVEDEREHASSRHARLDRVVDDLDLAYGKLESMV